MKKMSKGSQNEQLMLLINIVNVTIAFIINFNNIRIRVQIFQLFDMAAVHLNAHFQSMLRCRDDALQQIFIVVDRDERGGDSIFQLFDAKQALSHATRTKSGPGRERACPMLKNGAFWEKRHISSW